jgi:hypothetical protein
MSPRSHRKGIATAAVGAVFLIAAVAGFVILPGQKPALAAYCAFFANCHVMTGLSQSAYDALRIANWAVLIVGALVVALGVIRYTRPAVER